MKNKVKNTTFQLVVRIWTVHVMAIVLYLFVLLVFVRILGDKTALIAASVVVPVMYLVMTYLEAWRMGYRDRNMIKSGRVSDDKFRGIKAAVLSQIPGIVLGILSIAGVDTGIVSGGVRYFFMAMAYEMQNFGGIWYIIPALLPILSVIPGYALGRSDKRLVNRILYTRKNAD